MSFYRHYGWEKKSPLCETGYIVNVQLKCIKHLKQDSIKVKAKKNKQAITCVLYDVCVL